MTLATNKMEKQTISACMIVKDEEEFLPRCLSSIREHVDEIVIVDTGSTDNTVAIAESFGAKIHHHSWEHHFSKHRNQSLDYATGDWILIIDADEELLPLRDLTLHQVLPAEGDIDSVMIPVECASPTGVIRANSVRFLKNHRGIHYEGRVHNYLVGLEKSLFLEGVRLFHHGYNLGQAVDDRKFKRTTELLKLDILDNPQNPRPHHFLAASYMSRKMYASAAESAERAVHLFEKTRMVPHNYLWSLYIAAASRHALGEDAKAEDLAHKAIAFFPDHLDSHFVLSSISMKKDDSVLFEKHRDAYLTIHKEIGTNASKFGEMVQNTLSSEWLIHLWSGVTALMADKSSEANEYFQLSRRAAGSDIFFFRELAQLLKLKGRRADAESAELSLANCLIESGEYKSATDIVKDIFQKNSRPPVAAHRISALSQYHMGDLTASIRSFERMIESDPNLVEPYAYLAKIAAENVDFETCITACDQLLRILGLDRNIVLHSLMELGSQFFGIAEALVKKSEFGPARLCIETGRSLTAVGSNLQNSGEDTQSP